METTMVKLYRIPSCKICDEVEGTLKEFKPIVYDCSLHRNKEIKIGFKRVLGKFFGYPIIVIQCGDMLLMVAGYYEEMLKDIKKTIREMRKN